MPQPGKPVSRMCLARVPIFRFVAVLLGHTPRDALADGVKVRVRTKITSSSRREREDNHRLVACPFNGIGELVLARSGPLKEHEELLIEVDLPGDFLCLLAADGFDQGFLILDYGRFGSLEP